MFNLFKRDPVREKLKIPVELFTVTLAGASNACNILNGASVTYGKFFSREDIFAEVCGAHVKIVIATMSRMEGFVGTIEERFDRGAQFLLENLPTVLNRLKDPKMLNGLKSQGFKDTDLALMEQLLIADKTFNLAASYYMGITELVRQETHHVRQGSRVRQQGYRQWLSQNWRTTWLPPNGEDNRREDC
jgi:hypothetical protein